MVGGGGEDEAEKYTPVGAGTVPGAAAAEVGASGAVAAGAALAAEGRGGIGGCWRAEGVEGP